MKNKNLFTLLWCAVLFFIAPFFSNFSNASSPVPETPPDLVLLYSGDVRGNIKCTG